MVQQSALFGQPIPPQNSFIRVHDVLLTVQDTGFQCLHAQPKFDAHYQSFRGDTQADLQYLARKWAAGQK